MTWFIDRRLNGKNKSAVNRQRFLRRYKAQIKQSISEAINKRSVTDIESGESVSIPTDDINEPMFHQGRGGLRNRVHPGNDHFVQNDRIERPQGGGGGGGGGQGQASADGEGKDEFVFQISKDEYLDLLFEDLALPNLKKNQHRQLNEFKTHRAGFTSNGVPANISVVRSLQNSLARRTAMTAGKRRELRALEEDLETISRSEPVQLLEEERIDVAVSVNKQSRGEVVSEPVMTMGVTTLWSPQQIPCRGPLSVSDFVAWEHVMVAYRETGHGEIDRQLASQGLARRVRFATQNFSTFPLLLTTLPLFATVPQGLAQRWQAQYALRADATPVTYPEFTLCILRHKRRVQDPALNWLVAKLKQAMRGQ